ncbi:Bin3-type SAM domain-containing protein [Mycena kentingensis (nom. inval.)]|nr:Bin3-type SAM domain-containing protein [Mycena kentingensis (nom. inval.)]
MQKMDAVLQELLKIRPETDSYLPLLSSQASIRNYTATHVVKVKVPKRRRPEVSRLGVPEWHKDPPPAPQMVGTAHASPAPRYTTAHASVFQEDSSKKSPWLGLVLYSHAPPNFARPMYHNNAQVAGEVQLHLEKPASLGSIDVWFLLELDTLLDIAPPPFVCMTVCVWNRKMGDPRVLQDTSPAPFKGKIPAGTYCFPFEFPALPDDVVIRYPAGERIKNKTRVPLPPNFSLTSNSRTLAGFSGNLRYTVGVNVKREGFGSFDAAFDTPVQYLPLAKPAIAKTPNAFPYLPTHADWPFAREVADGWTLTPFGSRGKFRGHRVQVEGVLGVPSPAVYTAGDTIPFSLLLWSDDATTLAALAQPSSIDIVFAKSDLSALSAIDPKDLSSRSVERLMEGRIWLHEDGRPEGNNVNAPAATSNPFEGTAQRPPSPTESFEDFDAEDEQDASLGKNVVRLDGEVCVPACSHPSFRFISMGREYLICVLIKHPDYVALSPKGTSGVYGETPVWHVLDRFHNTTNVNANANANYAELPVKGDAIPLPAGAYHREVVVGHVAGEREKRPPSGAPRIVAF